MFNLASAKEAYIERMVPSYEGDQETLYPVPATKANFDRPVSTPAKHLKNSLYLGVGAGLGFLSLLIL